MSPESSPVQVREGFPPEQAGRTVADFLELLGGPTWFRFPGHDRSRVRAVSTLLHGNEPSGIRALHRWIQLGVTPAVDLVCFVGSVQAALAPPGFAYRVLPGYRDLNRCFRPPFDGIEGAVAAEVLERLRETRPEALIDVHNTSGAGPAYGVTTRLDRERKALVVPFSRRLIVTDLRLGALMEAVEEDFPTVTIECGGASDPEADALALEGLVRYAEADTVLESDRSDQVVVLEHPVRVELREGARVAYATAPVAGMDLTLRHDIDRFSFGVVRAGETLGWLGPRGLDALQARDSRGHDHVADLFVQEGDYVLTRRPLRVFMVTTNPGIALSDCLLYAIVGERT